MAPSVAPIANAGMAITTESTSPSLTTSVNGSTAALSGATKVGRAAAVYCERMSPVYGPMPIPPEKGMESIPASDACNSKDG